MIADHGFDLPQSVQGTPLGRRFGLHGQRSNRGQVFAQSAQDLFVELRDLYFATIRTLSGPNLGTSLHRAASHQLASKFAPIHRLDTEFKLPSLAASSVPNGSS